MSQIDQKIGECSQKLPQLIIHPKQKYLHDACTECFGTGVRQDGGMCIHGISYPCPRCSFR